MLITTPSRMPDLASSELVDLNVLDDDEALTLFTKIVGDKRAAAEPEATAELLLACAGLPLAIRICAARVATRRGWTIRTMADRLRDEHRRPLAKCLPWGGSFPGPRSEPGPLLLPQ